MRSPVGQDPNPPETGEKALLQSLASLEAEFLNFPAKPDQNSYFELTQILEKNLPPLYVAYDEFVSAMLAQREKPITCRKACTACCSHYVDSVEPMELLSIHLRIRNREDYPALLHAFHLRAVLFQGLCAEEAERNGDEEAGDKALYRYFLRSLPCPFLESDGACGVYDVRPMSCRMFFAESPSRYCAGKAVASPWNKNFQVELPEEAERALFRCSQALAALELPETLFAGLLAVNETLGRYDGTVSAEC